MADKETKLSLIIRAVDQATGPLKKINEQLQKQNAPFKAFGKELTKFGEESGLKRLGEAFKGVGTAAANVGKEAFLLGAKIAAIATGAGLAFYTVIRGAVTAGSELETTAKRVGLTVDAYAQLRFAAEQAGVPQEQFNTSMDQFNKRLGEVKAHSGPIYTFLGKVGPGLLKQVEGAKDNAEAFGLMTQAMESIPDPARRAALAAELFGKGGLEMGQFLGQGTAAIEEQKKKFLELAGPQDDFAKRARLLDKQMHETETAFLGVRNAVAAELFPALTELAKVVTGLVADNREGLAQWAKETGKAISEWVKGGGVKRLVQGLKDLKDTALPLIEKIGGLKGVLIGFGLVLAGPLIGSVFSLIGALGSLAIALIPFAPALAGFAVAALPFIAAAAGIGAAAYEVYTNWADIKSFFTEFWDDPARKWREIWGELKKEWKDVLAWTNPVGIAGKALGWAFSGSDKPAAAAPANPALASGGGGGGKAVVDVNFSSVPPGVSVSPQRGATADLNLSVGKAMSQ